MSIEYMLVSNHLVQDGKGYVARVHTHSNLGLREIVDQMIKGGSTVTSVDALAVLESAVLTAENMLALGHRVNFGGLVSLRPRIRGVFDGPTDNFDPARHVLGVSAVPGPEVRKNLNKNGQVEKINLTETTPIVQRYVDAATGEIDTTVTPGTIGSVEGVRLKYDPAEADEGLYFIDLATETETKVDIVQRNMPSELVFLVPQLSAGSYNIELRCRPNGTPDLRKGRFKTELTVS